MPNYSDNAPQGYGGDWSRGAPLGRGTKAPEHRTAAELEAEFIRLSQRISVCLRLKEARPSEGYKARYWQEEADECKAERETIRALIKAAGERAAYSPKVTLQRIRLDSGGYDHCGAYWGHGQPLFWAATDDGELDATFRASNRDAAKAHVRTLIPAARFYR
ncbi:hypothetical protein [Bosea massiliensis]|uniref:Uncharacterized protein n=1 Tax=Bosea massiliensis TaxID=151419 RepID=A0ABW0P9G4_9HYPH